MAKRRKAADPPPTKLLPNGKPRDPRLAGVSEENQDIDLDALKRELHIGEDHSTEIIRDRLTPLAESDAPIDSVEGLVRFYSRIIMNCQERTADKISAADKLAELRGVKQFRDKEGDIRRLSQSDLENAIDELVIPLLKSRLSVNHRVISAERFLEVERVLKAEGKLHLLTDPGPIKTEPEPTPEEDPEPDTLINGEPNKETTLPLEAQLTEAAHASP